VRHGLIVLWVVVFVGGIVGSSVTLSTILGGDTSGIGMDLNAYLAHTRRWLDGGSWYLPEQLAGPYVVEDLTGNVYPPTLLYLTVPFALGVPVVLWYAIPLGIIGWALWTARPSPWEWLLLALVAVYPRTWIVVLLGNPAMWAIAAAVAGVRWAWPAAFAALKLTFAPLALIGIRHRSWWVVATLCLALALPFGALWLDYLTVLRNTESSRGLGYVLGEWPIALALVAVALSRGGAGRSPATAR
jgi:hypothetical protein